MASKTNIRNFIVAFTPPVFYPLLRNLVNSSLSKNFYSPAWHTISHGPYKNISLYFDSENQSWGKLILSGKYDDYFYTYLKKMNISGKVFFDIGAHIGLSSLPFAKMIGKKGKVIAFEPNPANRERFQLNIEKNSNRGASIIVEPIALSNKNGVQEFFFTKNVDDGTSSGSFLSSAHTIMERSVYEEQLSFKKMKVKTMTLDTYCKQTKITPDVLKIDVEGAEDIVLDGAQKLLKTKKPTLFIELHSIFTAFTVTQKLKDHDYSLHILHQEKDGRVFIVAT